MDSNHKRKKKQEKKVASVYQQLTKLIWVQKNQQIGAESIRNYQDKGVLNHIKHKGHTTP